MSAAFSPSSRLLDLKGAVQQVQGQQDQRDRHQREAILSIGSMRMRFSVRREGVRHIREAGIFCVCAGGVHQQIARATNDTIVANRPSERNSGAIYNRILQALPSKVREEVLRVCHPIEFPPTHIIYRAGEAVEDAYFISSGLVSLIKGMADGRTTVIGAVGAEGLVGVFAAAGFERALADYIVEVPLAAFRVHRSVLRRQMAQHAALRHSVMKYLFLMSDRIAEISACNRLHSLEQRCCQWLLVAGDSACSDEFHLTHEFLALLLGVQRSSVSTTAMGLQKRGGIRYSRGHITILDRAVLEVNACECYRTRRQRIDEAFDPPAV